MGLFKNFVNQTRKPEGVLGKMMVRGMNSGHVKQADWGMSYLDEVEARRIVELGCGGGRNAAELLKHYPEAKLIAVDYSDISVEKAKKINREMIVAGRCLVKQASVASLPFKEGTFDLATAFETVYFWPGLERCFSEVNRVLKPGGHFMICNESDGMDETGLKYEKMIAGMKCYTVEQLTKVLKEAGFSKVRSWHHPKMPWITVLAKK